MTEKQLLLPASRRHAGEFAISTDTHRPAGATDHHQIGPINISTFAGVSVTRLIDEHGDDIGAFIGDVIDYRSHQVAGDVVELPTANTSSAPDRLHQVENFVFSHGGRWVFVYAENGRNLLFLDANGCNSVVFDPVLKRAASSTGLLLEDDEYVKRFDDELYAALGIDQNERWFPSGLTAHHGVHRLLCNHLLDLDNWTTERHWPRHDIEWSSDVEGTALRIAGIVRDTVETVSAQSRTAVSLTAGNETRFILASLREIADELQFVTVGAPGARLDVHHAQSLASRFELHHQVLPYREASAEEVLHWQYQASHSVGGNNMISHPSIRPVSSYGHLVGGLGGETGRGFFWRPGDDEGTKLDAQSLTVRFGMPVHPRVVEATDQWLDSTSGFNTLVQLDLAYVELRMSAWAFPQSYAQNAIVPQLYPMICRESFELMLQLAPDAKRNNRFIVDGISTLWPELLDLPINKYGDARDWVALANRVTPSRVARKLRRRFG